MSDAAVAGVALLAAFAAVEALAATLPGRWGRLPRALGLVVFFLAAVEGVRNDHGHPDAFAPVALVAVPLVVIFCGAAAGARRWYGWPDVGPLPGRAAVAGATMLLGVFVGLRLLEADMAETQRTGEDVAAVIRARAAQGSWPQRLDDALRPAAVPTTHFGAFGRPSYEWDASRRVLSFRIPGTRRRMETDASREERSWTTTP